MITRRALFRALMSAGAGLLPSRRLARADDAPSAPRPAAAESARAVWKTYYAGTRVWGYVDKHSVAAGEPFDLMLAAGPGHKTIRGAVEISRLGPYGAADRRLYWRRDDVEAPSAGPVQVSAGAIGAGWPTALENINTAGWPSGYYTIDFVDASDGQRDVNVAFIVVTNPHRSGDIVLELSTNTYQAYNEWGGFSFYTCGFLGTNAQMISFDRPTAPDFFEYEYFLALWLERTAAELGVAVDYATNFDVHRDPAFTERYRLFVSGAHNEYWSVEEFDAVHRRIFGLGKPTMFLGANTAYWQIRYADVNGPGHGARRGRQLICYKSIEDPIRYRVSPSEALRLITMRFRDEARRPETMLMGAAYQNYFNRATLPLITYPYVVARVDFPFFAGVGYRVGESIGDLVGYEWDNTDPEGDGRRLWDAKKSQILAIDPASLKVLFTGAPVDIDGRPGKAEAVYFVSKAGAKVFNAGSIRWAWGLGKPGFEQEKFKAFNRNLLRHFLE
jgi:hypothetical protein